MKFLMKLCKIALFPWDTDCVEDGNLTCVTAASLHMQFTSRTSD